jgi:hypothetical protein
MAGSSAVFPLEGVPFRKSHGWGPLEGSYGVGTVEGNPHWESPERFPSMGPGCGSPMGPQDWVPWRGQPLGSPVCCPLKLFHFRVPWRAPLVRSSGGVPLEGIRGRRPVGILQRVPLWGSTGVVPLERVP